jgi:hypothetical protein
MGQYHTLFNLDKLEVVNPHDLGFGAKQVEHTGFKGSLSDILYALTAYKSARGGGDFADDGGIFKGRWHGDRVAVIGDYYEESDLPAAWAEALSDIGEPTKFKSIADEIRPAVVALFDPRGENDYRDLSQQLADYAAVK